MGVESFFFHLIPSGSKLIPVEVGDGVIAIDFAGRSSVLASSVTEEITRSFDAKIYPSKFSTCFQNIHVENAIEIELRGESGFFQAATLSGCLSWYDDGLSLCYEIACAIKKKVDIQVFVKPDNFFSIEDKENFLYNIKRLYQKKHQEFVRNFGNIHAKILPNAFLDYYRSKTH